MSQDQADEVADNYQERVTRNEGRLAALEQLFLEIRESDRKLIEQRSDSLARELERRADALVELSDAQREADLREFRAKVDEMDLVRQLRVEQYAQAKQEHDALDAERWEHNRQVDEERVRTHMLRYAEDQKHAREEITAVIEGMHQTYLVQRGADTAARELQAIEYARRLEVLNHAHERQEEFQAKAVTRELYGAGLEAQLNRESVLRDQILALDRTILGLSSVSATDKGFSDLTARMERTVESLRESMESKITGLMDKQAEHKEQNDKEFSLLHKQLDLTAGRSSGYTQLYGWFIAAVGLIITVVVAANTLLK
jgi:hypothetical protein